MGAVSYSPSIVTMAVSVAVCEIMGGAIGGAREAMAPPIIWLGEPYCIWPPQYFALEFKILTLDLMQREENMFRVPLCWMCVHCKIHYLSNIL